MENKVFESIYTKASSLREATKMDEATSKKEAFISSIKALHEAKDAKPFDFLDKPEEEAIETIAALIKEFKAHKAFKDYYNDDTAAKMAKKVLGNLKKDQEKGEDDVTKASDMFYDVLDPVKDAIMTSEGISDEEDDSYNDLIEQDLIPAFFKLLKVEW